MLPAIRFALWGGAALAGRISVETAGRAVTAADHGHRVSGLAERTGEVDVTDALEVLADRGYASLAAALPVPGDPLGLPGPSPFSAAALDAGQAVIAHGSPSGVLVGLVAAPDRRGSSYVGVRWEVFDDVCSPVPGNLPPSVPDAERHLAQAIREAADELAQLDLAPWGAPTELSTLRESRTTIPPGVPGPIGQLVVKASRIREVVALARRMSPDAVSASAARERETWLRELDRAARHALLAACNPVAAGRPGGEALEGRQAADSR